jgi:hypothetical protein
MRPFFTILTIGLILVGFLVPIAWIGAVITGLLAIGSAPPGVRPDGKKRTGGVFGGAIDRYAVSRTMRECPYCKSLIRRDATKCPNCSEWVEPVSTVSEEAISAEGGIPEKLGDITASVFKWVLIVMVCIIALAVIAAIVIRLFYL